MIPDPGDYDQLVTLQAPPEALSTEASYGQERPDYETKTANLFAAIETLGGRDLWYTAQMQHQATHKVRMRKYSGITTRWRLRWENITPKRTLQIESITETPQREDEMVLFCVEQATGAA